MNALSVGTTTAILVFFMGYYRGSYEELLFDTIIRYQTAHIQVQRPNFSEADPDSWASPSNLISGWETLPGRIRSVPGVTGAAPRLLLSGYAGDGRDKLPVISVGILPDAERKVSVVLDSIVRGTGLTSPGTVLVGDSFAALFGMEPGSRCSVMTRTSYGAPNAQDFAVAGVFRTGYAALDRSTILLSLADAQALADSGDAVNKVFVMCSSAAAAGAAFPAVFDSAWKSGAEAKPWTVYARSLIEHSETETFFYYIFLGMIFALSVSTIANTMYVSVFERTREIGVMRAVGWRRRELFFLFMLEAATIGAIGAAVGLVVGGAASFLLRAFPIDVRSMAGSVDMPFFEIKSTPHWTDFALSSLAGIACAMAAGTSPARRAARMDVVKALAAR